jgi:hypothetical protein
MKKNSNRGSQHFIFRDSVTNYERKMTDDGPQTTHNKTIDNNQKAIANQ